MADKIFVMAESDTYFEAYKHNLTVLQNIKDLPFTKYIIECKEEIDTPAYLRKDDDIIYDLILTARPDTKFYIKNSADICTLSNEEDAPDTKNTITVSSVRFSGLKDEDWPCASELGLDDSQYRAVKNALTHEFSITQGPPGTGKTYVGLQIAKTLLANRRLWSEVKTPQQLLVVCYTNHALDQFLCSIDEFFEGRIVRVGGRSKSEVIRKRGVSTMYEHISNDILQTSSALRKTCSEYKKLIEDLKYHLCRIDIELLGKKSLEKYAGKIHESLISGFDMRINYINQHRDPKEKLDGSSFDVLKEWLGCGTLFKKTKYQVIFPALDEKLKSKQTDVKDIGNKDDTVHTNDDICCNEHIRYISKDQILLIAENAVNGSKTQEQKKRTGSVEFDEIIPATEQEQLSTPDLWKVPVPFRWRLYKRWCEQIKNDLRAKLAECEDAYKITCGTFRKQTQEMNIQALRQADIIGMTTTGAAKHFDVLSGVKPKVVIVEEAAEVLEAHIVTALSQECEHLILIGDHKQLKPSPAVYRLAKNFNLDVSLFERMINNNVRFECLEYQHRMRPEISELIRLFYPNLKDDDSVLDRPNIKGVAKNVYFVSHTNHEQQDDDNTSHSNEYEAHFLAAFCKYLLKHEYNPSKITVLTTYSAQMFLLRRLMRKKREFDGINISVVDNFQGEENDIILLSLVRSNVDEKIGFLKIENRVNVALSRAKDGLFVIGNLELMSKVSVLWANITGILKKRNEIGPALPLTCRNHPEKTLFASTEDDFQKVPEGGCDEQCDARLDCGHACRLKCHVYDTNHKWYRCTVLCTKLCQNGHQQLMLCSQDPVVLKCQGPCEYILECGHKCENKCYQTHTEQCQIEVTKLLPCGHSLPAPCYEENIKCPYPCETVLTCGHRCKNICGDEHESYCDVVVNKILMCGHPLISSCSDVECQVKCSEKLDCGHTCQERCSKPHTTVCMMLVSYTCLYGHETKRYCSEVFRQIMIECTAPCQIVLACGHRCHGTCNSCENGIFHVPCDRCGLPDSQDHSDGQMGNKTLPCIAPCRNQCSHRKCDKMCFEPCAGDGITNWPCQEKCEWSCEHKSCSKLCYEDCDRFLCAEPCQKKLGNSLFGPNCKGYCGETCGGHSYRCRNSCKKYETFHKSCKKPMKVKAIITKYFQTDYSCGSVCPSCHEPVLLDEKVFGKTVKKIHGKKETLKLQSIYYNRHAELKQKLDSIWKKVAKIDRSDSRSQYCRSRLEKLQGHFKKFLHFQIQAYLDMKSELHEQEETADALFAYQVISVLFQHAD